MKDRRDTGKRWIGAFFFLFCRANYYTTNFDYRDGVLGIKPQTFKESQEVEKILWMLEPRKDTLDVRATKRYFGC